MSVKISELPILDSLADNDIVAGVDVSGNVTSKIEMSTLKNYIDTNTQYTAGTNIDITNNVISAPDVPTKEEFDSLSTIFNAFPTESGEGESLTLDDTAEVKFKKFDLKGNTTQDGTPTPSSPIPVNVVSGDNEIVIRGNGKNLFNKDFHIINGSFISGSGGIASDSTLSYQDYFIEVEQNTEYTISSSVSTIYRIAKYDSNKTFINRPYNENPSRSYTINTGNAKYIKMAGTLTTALNSLQIEKNSSATTYEPYIGNTYNIDLPSGMELCKIGTYQDYFYKDSDKWYLHKEIGKAVYNGSEDYNYESSNRRFSHVIQDSKTTASRNMVYSNYYKYLSSGAEDGAIFNYSSVVYIYNYACTSIAEFKTWLGTHNTIVYYMLETPTTTEITDTTLISQLNAIEQAQSKENQTNISQVNNDLPFIISAEAILSLKNVLDRIELLES